MLSLRLIIVAFGIFICTSQAQGYEVCRSFVIGNQFRYSAEVGNTYSTFFYKSNTGLEELDITTINVPFDCAFTSYYDEFFLVGTLLDKSRLTNLIKDPSTGNYTVKWSWTFPTYDIITGVAYSDITGRLYFLSSESSNGVILSAPYIPGPNSGPISAQQLSYVTAADDMPHLWSDFDRLGNVGDLNLIEDSLEPVLNIKIYNEPDLDDLRPFVEMKHLVSGQCTFTVKYPDPFQQPYFANWYVQPGASSVDIIAPPGATVDLMKIDNGVPVHVGSVTVPSSSDVQNTCTLALTSPNVFEENKEYFLVSSTTTTPSVTIMPQFSIGTIDAFQENVIQKSEVLGFTFFKGNDYFDVDLCVLVSEAQQPLTCPVLLSLNNALSYTDLGNGRLMLTPLIHYSTTLELNPDVTLITSTKIDMPVPNDPGLIGTPFFFQWTIFDGVDYYLTDIVGASVGEG